MTVDDITFVLDALGGGGYRKSGDHVMTNCPLSPWKHASGQDSTRKMGVRVTDGPALVNCFYPDCYKGTLLGLVTECGGLKIAAGEMTMDEVSNLKAFVIMAEEDGETSTDFLHRPEKPIPDEVLALLGTGSQYWEDRGVSQTTQTMWRTGEAHGRALIPIIDRKGAVVGVQGRLLPDADEDSFPFDHHHFDDKYRTWPVGFKREQHLAGEHLLSKASELIIAVESPVDAMVLSEWLPDLKLPVKNPVAVAFMGGSVNSSQLQLIVDALAEGGEVCVGMDTDPAGRLAQRQVVDALRRRVPIITEISWGGKDPTDGGKDKALEAVSLRKAWLSQRLENLLTKT